MSNVFIQDSELVNGVLDSKEKNHHFITVQLKTVEVIIDISNISKQLRDELYGLEFQLDDNISTALSEQLNIEGRQIFFTLNESE